MSKLNEYLDGYSYESDPESNDESSCKEIQFTDGSPLITGGDSNDFNVDGGHREEIHVQSTQDEVIIMTNNNNQRKSDDEGEKSFEKIEMSEATGNNYLSIDSSGDKTLFKISLDTKYGNYLLLKILQNKNLLGFCGFGVNVVIVNLDYDGENVAVNYEILNKEIEQHDVIEKFYNLFQIWERCTVKVSSERLDFLTKITSGQIYLNKYKDEGVHLKDKFHHGVIYPGNNKLNGVSTLVGGVEMMKRRVEADIASRTKQLDEEEKLLLNMQEWMDYQDSKGEDLLILADDDNIMVVGITNRVTEFFEKMDSFLIENSKTSDIVYGEEIKMKYLKYHSKDDIRRISPSVEVTFNNDNVNLLGIKPQVKSVKEFVEKLIMKLEIDFFEESRPGLGSDTFNQSEDHSLRTLREIEDFHKCYVSVTDINKPVQKRGNCREIPRHGRSFLCKFVGRLTQIFGNGSSEGEKTRKEEVPSANQIPTSPIEVKFGSVTSSKDSLVLVNTLVSRNSHDLSQCGAISQSYLSAGGKELQREFGKSELPRVFGSELMITKATGSIQCEEIFHIYASKYRNTTSLKFLKEAIRMCLKEAVKRGHDSIAFPTIGCGKLGYRIPAVCSCFREVVEEFGNSIKITIYAKERQIFDQFADLLTPKPSSDQLDVPPNPVIETHEMIDPGQQGMDGQEKVITFTVCYPKDERMEEIKKKIHDKLKNIYSEQEIEDEVIGDVKECRALYENVMEKCTKSKVSLEWNDTEKTIYLRGLSNKVKDVERKIKQIFKEEKKALKNPLHLKKVRGTKAYLENIAKSESVVFPDHWKKYREVKVGIDQTFTKTKLDSNRNLYKQIENLVYKTWDVSKAHGQGKDAKNLSHSNIEVKNIFVVENPYLYLHYRSTQKALCYTAVNNGNLQIDKITRNNIEKDVITKNVSKDLDELLISEINEYYLFHGTKASKVEVIMKQGIDSRLSNENAMFGTGAYFAESSTKADQYTDDKNNRSNVGSNLSMFLVKVSLGKSFLVNTPQKLVRPPCSDNSCINDAFNCKDPVNHNLADSVVGLCRNDGSRLFFREFVTYKPDQSYPEFLIEYVRK